MRLVVAVVVALGIVLGTAVLVPRVLQPAPTAERLAGVTVSIVRFEVVEEFGASLLVVDLEITSPIEVCMGFALDQAFANRRLKEKDDKCVAPRAGSHAFTLLGGLTDSDISFPSHSLVWGVAGGRCGPVFELIGVCVVEFVDTIPLELPHDPVLPTFGPLGSFFPIFSFSPP